MSGVVLSSVARERFEVEVRRAVELGVLDRRSGEMLLKRGLGGSAVTIKSLGEEVGVTKQRAHSILKRALDRLVGSGGLTRDWIRLHMPHLVDGRVSWRHGVRGLRRLVRVWAREGVGGGGGVVGWHELHRRLGLALPEGGESDSVDLDEICERIYRFYGVRAVVRGRSAVCTWCGRSLSLDVFPKYVRGGEMPFCYCRECHNARMRAYNRARRRGEMMRDLRGARRLEKLAGMEVSG